ncbi:hypothetical protein [Sanguibacter sp. 25GB23B1]|uniref:hypothetical protein n=1 Tax=Sanguibacter sp. 25GB23B1 TaxID=3156067 RepID=UPI0032B00322
MDALDAADVFTEAAIGAGRIEIDAIVVWISMMREEIASIPTELFLTFGAAVLMAWASAPSMGPVSTRSSARMSRS